MPRKAFRIHRQTGDGETLPPRPLNLCRCCYRQTRHADTYCSDTCRQAHQRLRGAP